MKTLATALLLGTLAGPQTLETTAPDKAESALRVLSLNVWQEGTSVEGGFEKIVEVLAASDADLIALSEVRNYNDRDFVERLVEACEAKGIAYHGKFAGGDVGLLSRFPIRGAEPATTDASVTAGPIMAFQVELTDDVLAHVCVAHLDYTNYALYLPRGYDGKSFEMIDEDEDGEPDPVTKLSELHAMDRASGRDEAIKAFLRYAKKLQKKRVPLLLAGDFNEASHADWSRSTRNLWDHNGVVIKWENSERLTEAGFVDTWREAYPDPVLDPGHTWPSTAFGKDKTTWTPKSDERDRIDFIYRSREFRTVGAWVVGPRTYSVREETLAVSEEQPFALHGLPWPSDHKGVLVDVEYVR